MVKKKRHKITWFDVVNTVLMVLLSFIFLYPFWERLVISFSDNQYATSLGLKLLPPKIDLSSYKYVFEQGNIGNAYLNTIWRTVVGTASSVFVTWCAGYTLAKKDLPGRSFFTLFIVFTMFFSGGMIPTYLTIKSYNLLNSRWALILPCLTSAWNILIARNYVAGLPKELEEAARIDGAHPIQIAFRVIWPLSTPILAVLALWSAVGHWNAWFDAMIYMRGEKGEVLQIVLKRIMDSMEVKDSSSVFRLTSAMTTSEGVKSATLMVAIVPIICFYPFLQKYFMKGITVGAVKG